MPKIKHSSFFVVFIYFFTFAFFSHVKANSVFAARLLFAPSTGVMSGSTQVEVKVDGEGEAVESAVAVVTYNSSQMNVTSITQGNFFDTVNVDTTVSGEIAITGTLNLDRTGGVTGVGTLATITFAPTISSGTISLGFRCNNTDVNDSNIMSISGVNLLATNEQCVRNIVGSYTVGTTNATASATATSTPAPTAIATQSAQQPVLPNELPVAGPLNWLKWLTSGLALIGIGLLLL